MTPLEQALVGSINPTAFPGNKEVLNYTFYDTNSLVSATPSELVYFAAPRNTLLDGNFRGTAAFPAGQAFAVKGLRIILPPGTSVADQLVIAVGVTVTFQVDTAKRYFEGLVEDLPAGVGATAENEGANIGTVGFSNNGIASLGATKRFDYPIILREQQTFSITLACASLTLAATRRIRVAMDGVFVRAVA